MSKSVLLTLHRDHSIFSGPDFVHAQITDMILQFFLIKFVEGPSGLVEVSRRLPSETHTFFAVRRVLYLRFRIFLAESSLQRRADMVMFEL